MKLVWPALAIALIASPCDADGGKPVVATVATADGTASGQTFAFPPRTPKPS
jgi:hypothetical protein